jgi:precorrin-2/cobalt-factor-2 C20-methyltransferase
VRLIGIGVGPGDPEHLTLKALRCLKEADQVFVPAGGRAAEIVSAHVECTPLDFAMSDAASRDEHWDRAGQLIATVSGTAAFATIGDPNLYSTFTYIAHTVRALVPDVIIETVPGITAMQDLAARSGTVLAEGEERLALVPYTAGDASLREALGSFDTVIVYKGGRHLPHVLDAVREAGREPVYGENLGRTGETLTAPDGRAPYFSTVITPARREGRGSRL